MFNRKPQKSISQNFQDEEKKIPGAMKTINPLQKPINAEMLLNKLSIG